MLLTYKPLKLGFPSLGNVQNLQSQGEKERGDYFFVTKNKFCKMIDHNLLVSFLSMPLSINGKYKGISK